jgi:hypothetical protein
MKTAICTVVIGERFERLFDLYVLASWQGYCSRHGYELVVFRRQLTILLNKSPSWQKLFILRQPELRGFQKIIWLDADIIIRSDAPPIEVPPGCLGYVQERPVTGSVESWYKMFSLPPAPDIVQGGVLCLEPEHDCILQEVVSFPETALYEMPALSTCVSRAEIGYRLDSRFNAVVPVLMEKYVPRWIVTNKPIKELLWQLHYPPLRRAVREICENSWFIHAAGAKRDLLKIHRYLSRTG